uniref:Transposase Tc1-like domain-containing protein n=1 Tax=Anguilla anguilla TaxID=7936 RepID=A0A0E9XCZ0_ANGAN
MWHCHRMPPVQQVSLSYFCLASAVPVNCKCCNCEVEMSRSNSSSATSGWPHKLRTGLPSAEVLARKNCLSSVATLITEFQTASGCNVSTRSSHRELHEMGFHGRATTHKPKITMRNAKRWLEWCKAHQHWTLKQWKHILCSVESCFTIWQMDKSGYGECRRTPLTSQ